MTAETPTPRNSPCCPKCGWVLYDGHVCQNKFCDMDHVHEPSYRTEQEKWDWIAYACAKFYSLSQLETRCAELEEENARLDHCYKLSLDSMQLHKDKADELRRDRERLLNTIKDAADAVSIEINPSNYDHEQVCELNRQTCYAMGILDAAIRDSRTGNEREASPPAAG